LVYSTYLGGLATDFAYGITVDSGGVAYVAGSTTSPNFPTVSPIQAASGGSMDAWLSQINAAGTALSFSTYLGGSDSDAANAIAFSSGIAYVAGQTRSTNFPRLNAYQNYGYSEGNAFLSKIVIAAVLQNGTVSPSSGTAASQ